LVVGKHIQIRDVPGDVHAKLRARAEEQGLSLSEYLRRELAQLAEMPSLAEVLGRAATRGSGGITADQAFALIREDRDNR
jgi:hypothetical protein